jgi:hypothetical protein
VTSRQLIRWSSRHERRARRWWSSPWLIALVAAFALHVPVVQRLHESGPTAASHAWLALALVAFALAFMRVPFHLYWRADAALLAQLPIPGAALLDAALWRSARAALATTLATVLAALPLVHVSTELFARHAALAGVLGLAAGALMPAVALGAASLVAAERSGALAKTGAPVSAGAMLGALPGFASSLVIVVVIIGNDAGLIALAATSVVALAVTRAAVPRIMGTILRDVSALDRQRLASLEIKPPTALERAVASLLGEGGIIYRKDARLVRRRYPMAFALGALAFLVLVIVGLSRPEDPMSWLVGTVGAAALYALALAGRLFRAPIELPRLAATLPISSSARTRAKIVWVAVWLAIFVVAPAAFALARA